MSEMEQILEALDAAEEMAVQFDLNIDGPTRTAIAKAFPIAQRLAKALPEAVEKLEAVESELVDLVLTAFKNDRDRTFDIYDAPDDAEACIVVTPKLYRLIGEALLTLKGEQ